MKKILFSALLSTLLLFVPVMTASAVDYTIKKGGVSQTVAGYTTWPALVSEISGYTGTDESPVEVAITDLTLTKSDMGGRTAGGWIPGLIINSDNLSYTTITFNNCEFNTPDYPGLGFEAMRYPGNKLVFKSCNFYGYSIYGINSANEGNYAIDFEFLNCKFLNGAGIGNGGCWYGDMTIDGCEITGQFNGTCGYDGHFRKNSKGDSSNCRIANTVFTNASPGKMGVFANMFSSITYKVAEESPYNLLYKAKGYPIQVYEYLGEFAAGEEYTLDTTEGEYFSIFGYAVSRMFYNANGGDGTTEDTNTYIPGYDNVTLKANKFTKPGYAFTSWNTKADGSGTSYDAGQTITMPFGANFTLYGQWEEASGPSTLSIEVTGLSKGESEVFGVYSVAEGGAETFVMNVAVTGDGTGTDASAVTSLPAGTYSVKPTGWAWAYTNSTAAQSVTVADGTTSTAEFTLTAKSDQPSHVENVRVNQFK